MTNESHLHGPSHDEVWDLIPWLVNGRLGAAQSAAVNAHMQNCAACAREYAEQLRVCTGMQADDGIAFASEAAFQKLSARLDAPPAEPRAAAFAARWLAIAGLAAALGLIAWGGSLLQHPPGRAASGAYVTLTAAPSLARGGAKLRVVFAADLPLSELQSLLHSIDAHISDGPTEAGVFTLTLAGEPHSSAEVARRLAVLRADANVRFAEPVVSAP